MFNFAIKICEVKYVDKFMFSNQDILELLTSNSGGKKNKNSVKHFHFHIRQFDLFSNNLNTH